MERLEEIKLEKEKLEQIKNKRDLTIDDLKFLYRYDELKLEKEFSDKAIQEEVNKITKNRDRYEDYSLIYNCSKDEIGFFNEKTVKEILDGRKLIYYNNGNPYNEILIDGNKAMEKIVFPDYMIGRIHTENVDGLENKQLPKIVNGQIFMNDIEYIKDIMFPKYSLWTQLTNVKKCDDVVFQKKIDGPFMMTAVTELKYTKLPEEIIGYVMMYSLRKGDNVTLPKYVKKFFDLKELESLDGINVPKDFKYGRLSCKNIDEEKFKVKSKEHWVYL